ncbi:hypothetical protein IV203_001939 [Nitzschia inconspicua]|uniref:Uncharacterized protein n=1 Tax=Nitzschia inconspicua TaxID=303405 RepID=A0A9K3PRZ8_9STRA|nr:hypothetical protein IV203_001939 [Nitzschia inconspicua]
MFDLQNSWGIYLGQHLQVIKDRFPHHEDFKNPAHAPKEQVTLWWCAMRNSFLKRCKKFQAANGDDVVFGIEPVVPLYKNNSLAIGPFIPGDPFAAVDQRSVLLEKVQKATDRKSKSLEERCWLEFVGEALARGGEVRSLNYDILEDGLHRNIEEIGGMQNVVFPSLRKTGKSSTAKLLTQAIQKCLPDNIKIPKDTVTENWALTNCLEILQIAVTQLTEAKEAKEELKQEAKCSLGGRVHAYKNELIKKLGLDKHNSKIAPKDQPLIFWNNAKAHTSGTPPGQQSIARLLRKSAPTSAVDASRTAASDTVPMPAHAAGQQTWTSPAIVSPAIVSLQKPSRLKPCSHSQKQRRLNGTDTALAPATDSLPTGELGVMKNLNAKHKKIGSLKDGHMVLPRNNVVKPGLAVGLCGSFPSHCQMGELVWASNANGVVTKHQCGMCGYRTHEALCCPNNVDTGSYHCYYYSNGLIRPKLDAAQNSHSEHQLQARQQLTQYKPLSSVWRFALIMAFFLSTRILGGGGLGGGVTFESAPCGLRVRLWKANGVLCVHDMAYIRQQMKWKFEDVLDQAIDEYHKYRTQRELYRQNFVPVWWLLLEPDMTTLPPDVARRLMLGRPKAVRLRKNSHYSHEPESHQRFAAVATSPVTM